METQINFKKYYSGLIFINLFCLLVFLFILGNFKDNKIIVNADLWTNSFAETLHGPILNKVFILITFIGDPIVLTLLSVITLIILIFMNKWYYFLLLFSGMASGEFVKSNIKNIIQRTRPENSIIDVTGYSLPSGHATLATIFFILLAYSFRNKIKNLKLKYIFTISSLSLFLLIGLSRVYLNAHWLSDVLAGFFLGIFCVTLWILILKSAILFIGDKKLEKIKKILADHISYLKS